MTEETYHMRRADDTRIAAIDKRVVKIETRERDCRKTTTDSIRRLDKKIDLLCAKFDDFRREFSTYREDRALKNGDAKAERIRTDAEQDKEIAVLKFRYTIGGGMGVGGLIGLIEIVKTLIER